MEDIDVAAARDIVAQAQAKVSAAVDEVRLYSLYQFEKRELLTRS